MSALIRWKTFITFLFWAISSLVTAQEDWAEAHLGSKFTTSLAAALQPRTPEFERLEFLGDRVLGLIAAQLLLELYRSSTFDQLAPKFERIVSKEILVRIYQNLLIDQSWLASDAYQAPLLGSIAQKTASDVIEALMGALFVEENLKVARKFGISMFKDILNLYGPLEPITILKRLSIRMPSPEKVADIQRAVVYNFKDIHVLQEAFWHPSSGGSWYKKLDFLGIRVLALAIAEQLYNEYNNGDEGVLTSRFIEHISNDRLQDTFRTWHLRRYLSSQYIVIQRIPKNVAASTVRSFIGAVYVDGGWQSARTVSRTLFSKGILSDERQLLVDTNNQNSEQKETLQEEWPLLAEELRSNTKRAVQEPRSAGAIEGPSYAAILAKKETLQEEWPLLAEELRSNTKRAVQEPRSAGAIEGPSYAAILAKKEKVEAWPALPGVASLYTQPLPRTVEIRVKHKKKKDEHLFGRVGY